MNQAFSGSHGGLDFRHTLVPEDKGLVLWQLPVLDYSMCYQCSEELGNPARNFEKILWPTTLKVPPNTFCNNGRVHFDWLSFKKKVSPHPSPRYTTAYSSHTLRSSGLTPRTGGTLLVAVVAGLCIGPPAFFPLNTTEKVHEVGGGWRRVEELVEGKGI